jgi:outer membrane receptor protein involved in Fe transport
MNRRSRVFSLILGVLCGATAFSAEPVGSIRGMVYDSDFDAPLGAARITIAETEQTAVTSDQGNYVLNEVAPGTYTLVFSKDGYTRQVRANVVVSPGQMSEVSVSLSGEFEEMEEFIVQDVQIGTGTEAALLDLRMESPALMDSISAELMSQAGASDAAAALNLVSGATVQDGKYATIRGLPDRYVNSQMNGVRLPTADPDKRAVQLDQFPAGVIDSIQVSKTFTPDQQGDASGGAVNVVLRGIPEERVFNISAQTGYNTNVKDAGSDFLTYKGGGVDFWGTDDGGRDPQLDKLNQSWDGAAGVSTASPPTDYKWSVAFGDKWDFDDFRIGAFGSFFYDRSSSHTSGINDRFIVTAAEVASGTPYRMTPHFSGRGSPGDNDEVWYTSLFDVTQSTRQVQWGGLGVLGFETENHFLDLAYMYTRDATDKVTLAENKRGRESLYTYWPHLYPTLEGIKFDDLLMGDLNNASPPMRNETLDYTERTTETLQLKGGHTLPDLDVGVSNLFTFLSPELDWTVAVSSSRLYQPDKRQLATIWTPYPPGDPFEPGAHSPLQVDSNLGNLQRMWKDIQEDSDQYAVNLKLPFEQWSGDEGYLKFGSFDDRVKRTYQQDSFTNLGETGYYLGGWDDRWSQYWSDEEHQIRQSNFDVDYDGNQDISALYWMTDIPFNSYFKLVGGMRYEKTDISIENNPDLNNGRIDVQWYAFSFTPEGAMSVSTQEFDPEDTDVAYTQNDVLPSLGFEFKPWESVTFRGSYSETVARQTFKELSPIQQQEYLGGGIFAGNPDLKMSALKNYDLRFDWTPYQGSLFSLSYFYKDIEDPIEYIQVVGNYDTFTSVINYPEGELSGFEVEVRQELGRFWDELNGVKVGANATLIDSEVTLSDGEIKRFQSQGINMSPTRDMTNAPEFLYNLYMTYDLEQTGTHLGLFYTVRGDTLIAGEGVEGSKFVPSVYETEYGTLNFSLSQKLGEIWTLKFQAKNLLDPEIETVYRSKFISDDVTKTSYTKGREFSISLSASF